VDSFINSHSLTFSISAVHSQFRFNIGTSRRRTFDIVICIWTLLKRTNVQQLYTRLLYSNLNYRLNKRWSSTMCFFIIQSHIRISNYVVWRWLIPIDADRPTSTLIIVIVLVIVVVIIIVVLIVVGIIVTVVVIVVFIVDNFYLLSRIAYVWFKILYLTFLLIQHHKHL